MISIGLSLSSSANNNEVVGGGGAGESPRDLKKPAYHGNWIFDQLTCVKYNVVTRTIEARPAEKGTLADVLACNDLVTKHGGSLSDCKKLDPGRAAGEEQVLQPVVAEKYTAKKGHDPLILGLYEGWYLLQRDPFEANPQKKLCNYASTGTYKAHLSLGFNATTERAYDASCKKAGRAYSVLEGLKTFPRKGQHHLGIPARRGNNMDLDYQILNRDVLKITYKNKEGHRCTEEWRRLSVKEAIDLRTQQEAKAESCFLTCFDWLWK